MKTLIKIFNILGMLFWFTVAAVYCIAQTSAVQSISAPKKMAAECAAKIQSSCKLEKIK